MSDPMEGLAAAAASDRRDPRLLGLFAPWRLQAYGCAIATLYAALLLRLYHDGAWLLDDGGLPHYTDFTCAYIAGLQALHGQTAPLYDAAEFLKIQTAIAGPRVTYTTWPYPPTFFLILAPLAMLPYLAAFLTWGAVTLLACIASVYSIVRRLPAIALVLASPFTFWNFFAGQSGLLTASLLGAALLFLERKPVVAGVFIGCLTYKPHFGVLLPVALAASRQWRAVASAAVTSALLASVSIVEFGTEVWGAFPQALIAHANGVVLIDAPNPREYWGKVQTVYGLVRYLNGSAVLAWVAQAAITLILAGMVWHVWRSQTRYPLKAATLSVAVLIGTPYAFAYDLAAIAIPVAFLASDQMRAGLVRGEQTALLVLFAVSLAVLFTLAKVPLGPLIEIGLLSLILRRALGLGALAIL